MARFTYHTVGYGVFSLLGERYRMGRIEIFDNQDGCGYATSEGEYCMPFEAAAKFEEFIEVVKKYPNIDILQKLYVVIKPLLKASKPDIENGEDIKEIVNNFIKKINKLIEDKINKVNWWAIIRGGKKDIQNLYLLPSDETIKRITSTNNQLSSAIIQFKGNGLYVNGNVLLDIQKSPSEKENLKEEIEE